MNVSVHIYTHTNIYKYIYTHMHNLERMELPDKSIEKCEITNERSIVFRLFSFFFWDKGLAIALKWCGYP